MLADFARDLAARTELARGLRDNHATVGLRNGREDRVSVPRREGLQINDLRVHADGRQLLGCIHHLRAHRAVPDKREIRSGLDYFGAPKFGYLVAVADLSTGAHHAEALDE